MSGVLANTRVLDLSWGIAGPMMTMLLADHGADVTKIEPPGGDPFRSQLGYKVWQRGKRSAVLDIKQPADRDALLNLVKEADVFVESFSPGVTTRLGIDYDTLKAINPRLVYCSITAYGRDNPHSLRPGYDALVAARTGLFWEQRGWPEGPLNRMSGIEDPFADLEFPDDWLQGAPRPGPLFNASPWPSMAACFAALLGVNCALLARRYTGRGQRVETSLLQGAMLSAGTVWQRAQHLDSENFQSWMMGGKSLRGHFRCADGQWVHNWVPNPRFILGAAEGDRLNSNPDMSVQNDPARFGTDPEEIIAVMSYYPQMVEAVGKFPAAEWVQAAAVAGATMQAIRSTEQALTDPALLADGCVAEVEDPELGRIRQVGITYTLTNSPGIIRGPAPRVGEHTEAVKAQAAALAKAGIGTAGKIPAQPAVLARPLQRITVLDLGLAVAGPYATQLLSDMGANVIKINALHDAYWHRNHIAFAANRGKRSIAMNLKDPRAMKILHELVRSADVVHHNMRYDAAQRLGIDYDSLKQINPRLIYGLSRGYEKDSERQYLPGNDQTAAALAGMQYEDGGMARGGKPLWSLTSLGDLGSGFLSAIGIVQALNERHETGVGQMVDTSIINACLLGTSHAVAYPDGRGLERPRLDGMQFGFSALQRLYETAQGWLCVVILTEREWRALCTHPQFQALAGDARFATAAARADNDAALADALAGMFAARPVAAWFKELDEAGVPCEICASDFALQVHDDADMHQRGWVVSYRHREVGKLNQIGLPVDLSDTPGRVQGPPLIVGADTRDILLELGYSNAEIDQFCREGYIAEWRPDQG